VPKDVPCFAGLLYPRAQLDSSADTFPVYTKIRAIENPSRLPFLLSHVNDDRGERNDACFLAVRREA
jgi:hypothetical protein